MFTFGFAGKSLHLLSFVVNRTDLLHIPSLSQLHLKVDRLTDR